MHAVHVARRLHGGPEGTTDGGEGGPPPPTSDAAPDAPLPPDASPDSGPPTRASRYRDAVIADGPLAYWRFDETSGTTAKDEMGDYDGTYMLSPKLGQVGAFEGSRAVSFVKDTDARMIVVGKKDFQFLGNAPYTVEVWVHPGRFANYQWLVTTERSFDTRAGWSVLTDVDALLHYEMWQNDGGVGSNDLLRAFTSDPGATLKLGSWQYVVVAYDGTTVNAWLDGARIGTQSWPKPTTSGGDLVVGCYGDGTQCLDDWLLDDLAIYDWALDDEIVAKHLAIIQK